MKRLIKLLTVIVLMTLSIHTTAFAQSAVAKYNEGIELMQKGDYNAAISSFKASMAVNKSTANKKKCNKQIAECKRLMAKHPATSDTERPAESNTTLTLSQSRLAFAASPQEQQRVGVEVMPQTSDWKAEVQDKHNWIELSKSMDGHEIIIACSPNEQTTERQATISVTCGNKSKTLTIVQRGRELTLGASPNYANFKLKGGKILVNISCNSDTTYSNGRNWDVIQHPEWLRVEATETTLILEAQKLEKNDPGYKGGRQGEVIIVSQSTRHVLPVKQKRKFL